MFFRNVWSAAELTNSCKAVLLNRCRSSKSHVHIQCRSAFQNSRRGGRRGIESDPLEHLHIESGPLNAKGLVKPFLFAVGVSTASLAGCVIWEYENVRIHTSTLLKRPSTWLSAQQKKLTHFKSEPGPVKKWWHSLRDSEKVFYPILAANVLVFGAWRVRALQPYMVKYFCSNPTGSAICLPMLLSTFSHYSAFHLAANMYVLYSFMPAAIAALGKEQFVAMYLSAGVISSFASFLYKVAFNQPGLSLGASGAIMSVLSYVCVQYPDTRLSIIFLPMYTFAAGTVPRKPDIRKKWLDLARRKCDGMSVTSPIYFCEDHFDAIKAIMSVDLAGVLLGWKFFDHAAHLGGAVFGIAWCYWGGSHVWANRDKFLQYYHALRKPDTGR